MSRVCPYLVAASRLSKQTNIGDCTADPAPPHCCGQEYSERRSLRAELRQLQKEERKRQDRAVTEVIRAAQVVCATLTGALGRNLEGNNGRFDVVYIDEAAQVRALMAHVR